MNPEPTLRKRNIALGIVVLTIVVFIAYFSALSLSFVGDDWIFFELAGRLNLEEYLVKYFDPRVQTAWYRPVQGVLFRVGYDVFGTNQVGYHLVNVLIHLGNSVLLFLLVGRALKRWFVAFLAGLLFATFPIAVEGVFKAGVIDPVTALFFLIAIWFWLGYLAKGSSRDYWLAFGAFLIALLSKEIAITLPVTLFLFDRFAVPNKTSIKQLAQRYMWFVLAWIAYLPLEYLVVSRSVFVHREGYQPSLRLFSNLIDYLAGLTFPWGFIPPLSYVWLAVVAAILTYLILFRKVYAFIPIVVGAILAVLPIVLFPEVSFRFDYVSLTASAFFFALLLDWVARKLPAALPFRRAVILAGVVIIAAIGSAQVTKATADFGEFARVSRVTFRNIRQQHPTLPQDTLVYVVDPPLPGPNLSGMLFWYYGPGVTGLANDSARMAGLREHAAAYVYYFDGDGNQKEIRVEKEMRPRANPAPPFNFSAPIRLEGFELANSTVKRGESIVLFLYWRGLGRMETDYVTSVQLLDARNTAVATYAKPPRRGNAPTSAWTPGELIVDVVPLAVPAQTPIGPFRLEVGLYDAGTKQSAGMISIEPVDISE
ncbi:MAG: glycosyltransferase family 39 protein [Chloroflexi bacterium]|nr:glycosyltransferase family 39 protein [Chloroflexota bacterium]